MQVREVVAREPQQARAPLRLELVQTLRLELGEDAVVVRVRRVGVGAEVRVGPALDERLERAAQRLAYRRDRLLGGLTGGAQLGRRPGDDGVERVESGGRVVTSEQALTLDEVPQRVVVIGGSVIGVEFASVWNSLGAEVTIVEALDRLVPLEDPVLSKGLERAFRKRKIAFRTGVKFTGVEQDDSGAHVSLEDGTQLDADLVLVAVGRGPNSGGMGFEDAGLSLERGWVPTDERLHTNLDGVYAVGDLVPGLQLAHRGFAHGIFVAEDIAGLNPAPVVDSGIPRVTYCEPELASVGLTEQQARDEYGEVETVEYNLGGNGKSQILQTAGLVKLVRQADGPIVGVHMIGARMGEQVGEASLLVNWEAYPDDVAPLIHAHPTQNESLGEAALALAGKPLHSHA